MEKKCVHLWTENFRLTLSCASASLFASTIRFMRVKMIMISHGWSEREPQNWIDFIIHYANREWWFHWQMRLQLEQIHNYHFFFSLFQFTLHVKVGVCSSFVLFIINIPCYLSLKYLFIPFASSCWEPCSICRFYCESGRKKEESRQKRAEKQQITSQMEEWKKSWQKMTLHEC